MLAVFVEPGDEKIVLKLYAERLVSGHGSLGLGLFARPQVRAGAKLEMLSKAVVVVLVGDAVCLAN